MTHRHDFGWRMELDGSARPRWRVFARCACGAVAPWECAVATTEELRDRLTRAFQAGQIAPQAYFTAPVAVTVAVVDVAVTAEAVRG